MMVCALLFLKEIVPHIGTTKKFNIARKRILSEKWAGQHPVPLITWRHGQMWDTRCPSANLGGHPLSMNFIPAYEKAQSM